MTQSKGRLARRAAVVAAAVTPFAFLAAQPAAQPPQLSYGRDIAPIFRARCVNCHSGASPAGKLDLSTYEGIKRGGASGLLWTSKGQDASLLMRRLTGKQGPQMPMGMPSLSKADLKSIRTWIEDGGKFDKGTPPKHWAYVAPVMPEVPDLHSKWIRNPIDAFVLAKLGSQNLHPSPEATKETLIRRVSLDLTGLPPTPQEIDAFLADKQAGAYERLVDRLLASPHYGEKQAVGWLDLARYADTDGYEKDLRRVAWEYRDWVINAFNHNQPYDQFTIDQIAGDLLPNATLDDKIATGFQRNTMFNREGGVDQEEAHFSVIEDRAETTATVWLGSTLGCARCHDHKYDPFTQRDYYKMVAFYTNTEVYPRGPKSVGEEKWFEAELPVPSPAQADLKKQLESHVAALQSRFSDPSPEVLQAYNDWRAHLADLVDWTSVVPNQAASRNGTRLAVHPDGTVAAEGMRPATDAYTLQCAAPATPTTGLRLEVLSDPSLPNSGPGRAGNGNFVLSGIKVSANGAEVPMTVAMSDYSQPDFPAIDSLKDGATTGWAIDGQTGKSHQIVFQFDRPVSPGARLSIVLDQQYRIHSIGRFRLSLTGSPALFNSVVPQGTRELAAKPGDPKQLRDYFLSITPELGQARADLAAGQRKLGELSDQIPSALVMQEKPWKGPLTEWVRHKGVFSSRTQEVKAGTPDVLPPLKTGKADRLALARWLVSKQNPLTARVEVNRLWEECFGRGIVETSEDFGTRCSPPTHPELLDWLACKFMDEGWNIKAIVKLIVTSSTYRQTSAATPELLEKDSRNLWLARGPKFRLDAEAIHDTALEASGLLSPKIGGPSVFPYQPEGIWDSPYNGDRWMPSKGDDRYRRAVYTFWKRTAPYPSFIAFDATSRESCTVRRIRTNTPLQALALLNDEFMMQASEALGARMMKAGSSDGAHLTEGFRLCTARRPKPGEAKRLEALVVKLRRRYADKPKEAAMLGGNASDAAYTLVGNVLLNLDETITKG